VGAAAKARALTLVRMSWLTQSESAALSPLDQIADLLPAPPAGVTSVVKNKRLACNPFVEAVHSVIDTPRIPAPAPGVAMWVSAFSSNTHWPRRKTRPSTTVPTQASLDDDTGIQRSVGRTII